MYRVTLILGLVCSARLSGCTPVTDPDLSPFNLAVTTDRSRYVLPADSLALVTLTNHSDQPVFLPMDSYVVYERLRDGEWRDAFAWFVVDGFGRSFPIAPGASNTDVLRLWFYLPDSPGTYRFRYYAYADSALKRLLPLDERVSAPFELR
jgi:hypothetical protein